MSHALVCEGCVRENKVERGKGWAKSRCRGMTRKLLPGHHGGVISLKTGGGGSIIVGE